MPSLATFKLIAIAALVAALAFFYHQSSTRGLKLDAVTIERDAALQSAADWKKASEVQVELAAESAKARSAETKSLLDIARAAGSTKEGIANAPGADAPFRYSDSAYRFMRARPEAGVEPAKADPGVVDR